MSEWENDFVKKKQKLHQNKEQYYYKQKELSSKYKEKYIAFSDGEVIASSDSNEEIFPLIEKDPSIFTVHVGHEDFKPSTTDVLILSDLVSSKDKKNMCFPYHSNEKEIIKNSHFTSNCGWCGSNRP
jgi:hypothetical protein